MYGENLELEEISSPKGDEFGKSGLLDQLFVTWRLKNDGVFERA
jgi:hypothetical protein